MLKNEETLKGRKILFLSSTDFSNRTREFREAVTLADAGAEVTVLGYAKGVPELWKDSRIHSLLFVPQTQTPIYSKNRYRFIRIFLNLSVNIIRRAWRKCVTRMIEQRHFYRAATKLRPDIVHAMDLPSLKDAAIIANNANAVLVYDASEYWRGFSKNATWDNERQVVKRYLKDEKRYIAKASLILTTSQTMSNRLKQDYNIENTLCLYNAPLCRGSFPEPLPVGEKLKVVFHGNIGPDRNLDGLLLALAAAPKNITLDVYGEFVLGAQSICEKIIKEEGLQDRVNLHGKFTYGEMLDFLPKYDLEFYPAKAVDGNFNITLPNKVFDCICSGLALVVPDFDSMREIIDSVNNGFVVDTDSQKALLDSLIWLVENKEMVTSYKKAAHNNAHLYSWECQAEKLLNAYSGLASEA